MLYDLLSLLWPLLPCLFLRVRLVSLGDSGCCVEGLRKVPVGHRTVGEESGKGCVEQQLARDCAHDSWALGDACSYLPAMSEVSRDGGEGMGPRQVELP